MDLSADSFQFQVVGNYSNIGLQYSSPVEQPITVQNINTRTVLNFDYSYPYENGNIEILAFSSMTEPNSDGYDHDITALCCVSSLCPCVVCRLFDVATINGFSAADYDYGTGLIAVHLNTNAGGLVSLNPHLLGYMIFIHGELCNNVLWECVGSGYAHSQMIFLGSPAQVVNALNGMTYQVNETIEC
jgi:hypothetical protein